MRRPTKATERLIGTGILLSVLIAGCRSRDMPANGARQAGAPRGGNAAALMVRADSLYSEAEFDSARVGYDRVVEAAGSAGDSATVARALTALGLTARNQGRFDDAKSIGERAVALEQRLGLVKDLAKAYNALGLLAQNRGRLEDALRLFAQTLQAAEAVNDSGYLAKSHANLGLVYQDLGEDDRSRAEFLLGRSLAARVHDARTEANTLNNLGRLEVHVGDPDAAIRWLSMARARYDSLHFVVGQENVLGQLAQAYWERGAANETFAYLDSARAIATKHGLRGPETDDLRLIAEMYVAAGDNRRALEYLSRARALCDSLEMRSNLGQVAIAEARAYAALGNNLTARERAKEAARLQRTAGAKYKQLDAELYGAELAQRSGDGQAAAADVANARSLAAQLGNATGRLKFALGAARVADVSRNSDDVLRLLDLDRRDAAYLTAEEQVEVDALRARAHFRRGSRQLAAEAGRRAVAGLERVRTSFGSGQLRASYAAGRIDVYSDLVVTLLAMHRVDEAFRVADAARGRGLVEHLGAAARGLRDKGSTVDMLAADSLLRRIDALVQRLRGADTTRSPQRSSSSNETERALADTRASYETLLGRSARSTKSSALLGGGDVDAEAVRQSLVKGEALLEFLSTTDGLIVFVASHDRLQTLQLPIGSRDLAERVHLAREMISARDSSARAPLHELHEKLIAPIERAGLLEGIESLIIAPHAALTYLPFSALSRSGVDGKQEYLVERYRILMIPSAAALSTVRARVPGAASAPPSIFAPLPKQLPGTEEEAETVARRLPRSRLITAARATEAAFRAALASSRVVHLASHGSLNPESPMFSNVELAAEANKRTGGDDDNGRLETHEVLALDVRSRLVFLSGCETGLGAAWSNSFDQGSDYATLAQAFLFAGASNVVATLWRIDDRAGALFAQHFYDNLAKGDPSKALAAAQRALIHDRQYAAAYYWAGYAISGSGVIKD